MSYRDNKPDHPDGDSDQSPSKTRLKKQMHDLQALGRDLLELPEARLVALQLPENLFDALTDLRRIRSHEGRRRQWQFVGKLMRNIDAAPLREAVAAWRVPGAKETLALHEAERWRERLIGSDAALTEWLDAHPGGDVQALRSLIRSARKDAAQASSEQPFEGAAERKGRAYRELFQQIRQTLAQAARDSKAADDIDFEQDEDDNDG